MRILTKTILVIATVMFVFTIALSVHIYTSPREKIIDDRTYLASEFMEKEGLRSNIDSLLFCGTWNRNNTEYNFMYNGIYNSYNPNYDDDLTSPDIDNIDNGTYEIMEEKQEVLLYDNMKSNLTQSYQYSFSNNNNTLNLIYPNNGTTISLKRQIKEVTSTDEAEKYVNQTVNVTGNFSVDPELNLGNIAFACGDYDSQIAIDLVNFSWNASALEGKKVQVQGNIVKTRAMQNLTWYPYPFFFARIEQILALEK